LRRFLHLLPPGAGLKEQEKLEQEHPEFQIDELFDVPEVGTVAGGLVTQGIITVKCSKVNDLTMQIVIGGHEVELGSI